MLEHNLAERPHTFLWLAETYVIPAGIYGSQTLGAGYLQAGRQFSSSLIKLLLHFLKDTLDVHTRCTTNWAVLRDCGYNRCSSTIFGQLSTSFLVLCVILSVTLRRMVQTDLNLQPC